MLTPKGGEEALTARRGGDGSTTRKKTGAKIKKCREEENKHKNFILVRPQPVPTSSPQATSDS